MSLYCVNHSAVPTYHRAITKALTTDFPLFEQCCEISPHSVCNHLQKKCRRARLALQGYARYYSTGHKFVPLPIEPIPLFKLLCDSCSLPRGECTEYCSAWATELWGYTVHQWDINQGKFKEFEIHRDTYNPLKHGYFSYKLYREGLKAQEDGKRKRKRAHESVEERKSKRAKETIEITSCSPSPPQTRSPSPEYF